MLSRFAAQTVCGSGMIKAVRLCAVQPVRWSSTSVDVPANLLPEYDPRIRAKLLGAKPEHDPNKRGIQPNEYEIPPVDPPFVPIEQQVANIKRAHNIFFGPERDFKNFPLEKQPVEFEPYNFLLVPTRYCKALYEKLGVSGSYTLFLGLVTTFLSKEITPVDHALPECIFIGLVGLTVYKKFAPKVESAFDKMYEEDLADVYHRPVAEANAMLDEDIAVYEKDIWRLNAIKPIFQAKKELIDLQMEVEYRERLQEVYKAVKNRLDYQADRDFLEKKFEQEHMVSWIVQNVKKSITAKQEKENIASCIQTLKQLSATAV